MGDIKGCCMVGSMNKITIVLLERIYIEMHLLCIGKDGSVPSRKMQCRSNSAAIHQSVLNAEL